MQSVIDLRAASACIKQNTLLFFGGANAGKSWIARGIADAFVNRALITGGNGSCCFLMEPAINKRVALVEEVMISEQATEMFKCVMEGTPTCVDRKGKTAVEMDRVPLIITCNVLPWVDTRWEHHQAFKSRCLIYHCKTRSEIDLKSDKALNPLSFMYLIEQWKTNNEVVDSDEELADAAKFYDDQCAEDSDVEDCPKKRTFHKAVIEESDEEEDLPAKRVKFAEAVKKIVGKQSKQTVLNTDNWRQKPMDVSTVEEVSDEEEDDPWCKGDPDKCSLLCQHRVSQCVYSETNVIPHHLSSLIRRLMTRGRQMM